MNIFYFCEMINYLPKVLLIIFSCLLPHFLNAQNLQKIDSLELSIEFTANPQNKIETLLELSSQLKNNNPDKALTYAEKAYNLSESENYDKGILNSLIIQANIYWSITDFETAMEIAEKAKEMATELNLPKELALSFRITGLIYI